MIEKKESDARVVVYTTDWCGYCHRAKGLLESRGIAYEEVHVPRTREGRTRLAEVAPRARTFPQIVIDGEPIGGYRELLDLSRAGRLDGLDRS